jgi:hypothetical protein
VTTSADFPNVKAYDVPEPIHADILDAFGERFTKDIAAGVFKPRNEREELLGEHLVSIGMATVTQAKKGE